MNYYENIKEILISNEITKKVKDYSKNRSDLESYYNVGKLLVEAQGGESRAKYGNGLIKEFSLKLVVEVGRQYNERTLRRMRQFYLMLKKEKWSLMATELSWSHYTELLPIKDFNEVKYYISQVKEHKLTKIQLRNKIKNHEYDRLSKETKNKLINKAEIDVNDFVKHPIILLNNGQDIINEKALQKLILENIPLFLKELGCGFTFIENEYKIKIGDRYNYIDLLLFNIQYNCYVVVELKTTELKKEHISQIEVYMNYIDKNLKTLNQEKTIGIIICKKDNHFIMEYCTDSRIYTTNYITI